MNYKLAIFDMDGTILDTLEDLTDSLNYALAAEGLPCRSIDEVRRFVGNGILKLVERGVPEGSSAATVQAVMNRFVDYYKVHCGDKTHPYAGIPQLLNRLKQAGMLRAVVSNKADFAVQELCIQYFDGLFDLAIGEREGISKKPAPDSVYEVLRRLNNGSKCGAVYIGDSDVDVQTAKNAGLPCIAVEWGFRDRAFLQSCGADVIVSNPDELASLLGV